MRPAPAASDGPGTRAPALRWVLFIVCVPIAVVASCLVSLEIPRVQQVLVRMWMENLDRHCGLSMQVRNFEWNWPLTVTVHEVEMRLDGRRLLECIEASVTFGISGLSPFWYVKEVVLDQPVFHLEKDLAGRWVVASPDSARSAKPCGPDNGGAARSFSQRTSVRVDGGTILAHQAGHSILRVGNVSGRLTLPYDGGVGVRSLLANLEKLRFPGPESMTFHRTDLRHRKGEGL